MDKPFLPDWLKHIPQESDPLDGGESGKASGSQVFLPEWISRDGPQVGYRPVQPVPGMVHEPLLVQNCRAVIPQKGVFLCDIRIENGIIHSLGTGLSQDGCTVVDADHGYVVPGIIDPHVHIGIFSSFEEEVISETRSALMNGVTTVGSYFAGKDPYIPQMDQCIRTISNTSYADVFLHLPIFTYEQLEELPLLYKRYGITSFKAYMAGIPGLIPSLDEGFILDLMEAVAALGEKAVLNIHAENYHIVEWAAEKMRSRKSDIRNLADWEQSHPGYAESEAVQRALFLAERSGARIYFVHISARESADILRQAVRSGRKFFAETTSPYLTLNTETAGNEALMIPPVRSKADQDVLWQALDEGLIQTIGTDHTPVTRDVKKSGGNLWDAMPGYPGVGTHLPTLLHEAKQRGFPLSKLIEAMTIAPARIFGLYPKKGTIMPGSDADLVILDEEKIRAITPQQAGSRSDFTLHQDREVSGWPVRVIKAGQVITPEHSRDLVPRTGRYLSRT